ncbi:MAG: hypothetical protein ABJA20_14905, partial [Novosphingobium sp.]
MGFIGFLLFVLGGALLLNTRSQMSRVEHRLRLVEEELRRWIAAGGPPVKVQRLPVAEVWTPKVEPERVPEPETTPEPTPVIPVKPVVPVEDEPLSPPVAAAVEAQPEPEVFPVVPQVIPAMAWRSPDAKLVQATEQAPESVIAALPEPEESAHSAPPMQRAAINFEE